jgi:hypothetical protein
MSIMTRKLVSLFLLLLSTSSMAAVDSVLTTDSVYQGFKQLLEHDTTLTSEELEKIDFDIRRVTLLHTEDRLFKRIPKQTQQMIEGQIISRLMETGRFIVVDCTQCSQIKVRVTEDKIKVNQTIETNEDLKIIAEELAVDAVFKWSANVIGNEFNIDIRLVRANNSQFEWNEQYSKILNQDPNDFKQSRWRTSLSYLAYSGTRENFSDKDTSPSFASLLAVGLKRVEKFSADSKLNYGLGAEYIFNFENTEYMPIRIVSLTARLGVDINILNANLYFEGGGAFAFDQGEHFIAKTGVEFLFPSSGYISIDSVYISERTYNWAEDDSVNLEETFDMGGLTFGATLGYRF